MCLLSANLFTTDARLTPITLQLSGHTHGGQVSFPIVGAPYLPPLGRKYPRGLRRIGPLVLYTNRGIRTRLLPIRFNCPPEIPVHAQITVALRGVSIREAHSEEGATSDRSLRPCRAGDYLAGRLRMQ